MPHQQEAFFPTGCIIEPPDERDFLYEDIAGGEVVLPKEFEIKNVPHFYQGPIDACVGMTVAAAKSLQEGKKLSPRVLWAMAKAAQGYRGWGTSITLTMSKLAEFGDTLFGKFNEEVLGVNREDYMRVTLTDAIKADMEQYKIKSYWRAGYSHRLIEQTKQALYEQNIPLITSMDWYSEYNYPTNGFLPNKRENAAGGHAFILKGWRTDKKGREYLVFQNSWRETWGDNGDFYIYTDELQNFGLGSFYVLTDIELDRAKIISRYKGQLIKNAKRDDMTEAEAAKVYYVGPNTGKLIWIENPAKFEYGRDERWWGDWGDIITIPERIEKEDIVF